MSELVAFSVTVLLVPTFRVSNSITGTSVTVSPVSTPTRLNRFELIDAVTERSYTLLVTVNEPVSVSSLAVTVPVAEPVARL